MRELKEEEVASVSGGNGFVAGVLGIVGAYNTGQWIGRQINRTFQSANNMSIGEYIYFKTR